MSQSYPQSDGPAESGLPSGDNPQGAQTPTPGTDAGRGGAGSGGRGPVNPGRLGFLPPGGGGGGGSTPPTLYVLDHLLLAQYLPVADQGALDRVQEAIREAGLPIDATVTRSPDEVTPVDNLTGVLAGLRDELWMTRIVLVPTDPGYQIDAQRVLAEIRRVAPGTAAGLALDHVLTPSGGTWGGIGGTWGGIGGTWGGIGGTWGGIGGTWGGIGTPAEYAVPGRGGRMPVHVAMAKPSRSKPVRGRRRPVVALPDTGIGKHPWFDGDPSVTVGASFRGVRIGGTNADLGDGVSDPLLGFLGALAGHGTFVAGIVRQSCPEASILSIPVMTLDGVAVESEVHTALVLLLLRHVDSALAKNPDGIVDVLSLSLGYYPDPTDDPQEEHRFRLLFRRYCEWGVVVCAGSGNDATRHPFYPAAFADTNDPDPSHFPVPLLAVGALNPGCRTTALFSNVGSWVRYLRCGASIVSTVPTTFRGGAQATQVGIGPVASVRSTIDPEDYTSGFGVWSGTSFSTPIVAADAARGLLVATDLDVLDQKAQCVRADAARAAVAETAS